MPSLNSPSLANCNPPIAAQYAPVHTETDPTGAHSIHQVKRYAFALPI
jgi:hypothetical protein